MGSSEDMAEAPKHPCKKHCIVSCAFSKRKGVVMVFEPCISSVVCAVSSGRWVVFSDPFLPFCGGGLRIFVWHVSPVLDVSW